MKGGALSGTGKRKQEKKRGIHQSWSRPWYLGADFKLSPKINSKTVSISWYIKSDESDSGEISEVQTLKERDNVKRVN